MRGSLFAVVAVGASLAWTGAVAAAPSGGERSPNVVSVSLPWSGLSVGVNDDSGKSDSLRDWVYPVMSGEGLRLDTLTVTWDESDPLTIPARAALTEAVAAAQENGIAIELDLYPLHSQAFTHGKRCRPSPDPKACGDSTRISEFAAWTAQVARAFPTVHEFVVMNECNQPRFINPQWNTSGENQSAAICGRALAAAYDALKAVNPSIFVWGVGLSPRGNDDPRAVSNSSTSPIRFLADLGAWFKAFATTTQRATPLMDGFDFHPYPVPQSLPFATGYANKNDATITNLARLYQTFFNAFNGSPQPTIGQQRGGGLPVSLNETGIQTASSDTNYVGWQPSTTTAGGVGGRWATQSYQARWYLAMLNLVACDPNIRLVNIFHLVDEPNGSGWQSGLYFADGSPKVSAGVVRSWIDSTGASCHGHKLIWKPGLQETSPKVDLSRLPLPSATAAMPPTLAPTANPDPNALSLAAPPPAAPATITPATANPLATTATAPTPDPATATPPAPSDTPPADTLQPADPAQTGG